jgi:hypothetical protein
MQGMCNSFHTGCLDFWSNWRVPLGLCEHFHEYKVDMYASDLTHKKRAETVFRNLQLQKEWFDSGKTIRILGQKGGNDYAYMTHVEEGCIQDKCWQLYVPIRNGLGSGPISSSTANMSQSNFTGVYDAGYGAQVFPIPGVLDDSFINIPMNGMDFFFGEVNYGAANNIVWNSNNILIFGPAFNPNLVSLDRNMCNAIMMGNYDRLCSSLFATTYSSNSGAFMITRIIVSFANYYTDRTNLDAGKLQIRLIKERDGSKRQWVEVGVISTVASPGYSNNPTVNYPSGADASGNPLDSNSFVIDSTKNSPWDVSNGTKFLQVAGSHYSTAFPPAGTTILYESDHLGNNWTFTPNAYFPV